MGLLEEELESLKKITGMGSALKLFWLPNINSEGVRGEVVNGVIKIYDREEEAAILTLRHEFLDYMISKQIIRPLIKRINLQSKLIDSLMYERKENVIEKIITLLETMA